MNCSAASIGLLAYGALTQDKNQRAESPRMARMRSLPMSTSTRCAIAAVALVVLGACSSASTEVLPPTVSVSIGQQLIDLKKARDAGALSDKEYQAQVKRVIDAAR